MFAELATGHVFTTDLKLRLGQGEIYNYFDNYSDALEYANSILSKRPDLEFCIYSPTGDFLLYKSINEEKSDLNSNKTESKRPKRILHIVGIGFIILMLCYIFIGKAIVEDKPQIIAILLLILLFVFSGYWRLYQYYKLGKLKKEHAKKDFVEYFDSLTFIRLLPHCVTPFPILRKPSNDLENKIRIQINIWTGIVWLTYGLLLYFWADFS